MIGSKPLSIRFDNMDEVIKIYDGTRYLVLFGPEKYDAINNIYFSSLLRESRSCFLWFFACRKNEHNVILLIKSVRNKDQNHYYYNIFSEKFSYEAAKK